MEKEKVIERVKARRLELSMSYQDLSDKTGISKSTLQRYETGGIHNLPADKIEQLANALRVSPSYLMGWENSKDTESYLPESFNSPQEAIQFILKQPTLMSFGDYDISSLSDDDIVNFANEILNILKMLSPKYK